MKWVLNLPPISAIALKRNTDSLLQNSVNNKKRLKIEPCTIILHDYNKHDYNKDKVEFDNLTSLEIIIFNKYYNP